MLSKPSVVTAAIRKAMHCKRPVMLAGSPGIGKSQLIKGLAQDLGLEFRDVRVTLLDPVDLRGLPSLEGGRTKWNPPAFLPTSGKGIFFWDEFNAGAQAVQIAAYQSLLDNRIGEYQWPEGWYQIAAGNLLSDGAGAQKMNSALNNRLLHLQMGADLEDWIQWALGAGISSEILAYLKWRPENLHNHSRDQAAYPTPRSWEFVSQILQAGASKQEEEALIAGAVGDGPASEFYLFLDQARKLPQLEEIWANPTKVPIPKEPSTKYAIAYALALRTSAKQHIKAMFTYLQRLNHEYNFSATVAWTRQTKHHGFLQHEGLLEQHLKVSGIDLAVRS